MEKGKQRTLDHFVLSSFIIIIILITFFMEIGYIGTYYVRWKSEKSIYEQTLKFYTQYWQTKFDMINSNLLMMNSPKFNEAYAGMGAEERTLEFELAKQEFLDKIQQATKINNEEFYIFFYDPGRNVYLKGNNSNYSYAESMQIRAAIDSQIEEETENRQKWIVLDTGRDYYFACVYSGEYGYVGAVVNIEFIVQSVGNSLNGDVSVVITDGLDRVLSGDGFSGKGRQEGPEELGDTHCRIWLVETMGAMGKRIALFSCQLLLMTAFVIGICIVIIKRNIRMVLRPLAELRTAMIRFGIGDMGARLEEECELSEMQDLYQSFNTMADKIQHLTIDVYGAELERQRVEYNYLKIQIQPHFYSNVLNLIYGLAEIRDYSSIQKLSIAMANYFRYLLSNKEAFVRMERELDCVKNYVEIQKMRYPDCIQYQLSCEGDTRGVLMPPIVIQTFVENGIQHNITICPVVIISVKIQVQKEEEKVRIQIEDNGSGFDVEILKRLKNRENISQDGRHIGIQNIVERLDALYGRGKAKIELKNTGQGACIVIELPLKTEVDGNESIIGR